MADSGHDTWGDWMRLAIGGDEAAYRRLLTALAPAMRAMVHRAVGGSGQGSADVEDIVQEILLAIHLKRGNWDPSQPFRPWVFGLARHKIIDAHRRRGRRIVVPLEDVEAMLEAAPAFSTEPQRDAERWLSRLGERDQAIVRAIAIQECSAADVSRSLGMQEGAVRVALHRALKKLAALARGDQR